jgi:hypothetical protein
MQIRKTLFALLALAIAFALSPLEGLQAASPMGPGSQPGTENLTYTVKAKAKAKGKKAPAKKAKAKGKKVASKGPGRCGAMMYWDKKKRSCATKVK